MEYYECDLYSHIKSSKKPLPTMEIKLFTYQAFRGLLYIHSLGICHRDIKPHNLLLRDGRLVICDFAWLNYHLAIALSAEENWEQALSYYRKAEQIQPDLPKLYG